MSDRPDYSPLLGRSTGVWRTNDGDDLVEVLLQWIKAFPEGSTAHSRRIEMQAMENGDKPHWSYQHCGFSNYFKFAQLTGSVDSVPPVSAYVEMVDAEIPLFMSRLDPHGASARTSQAWWKVARAVLNGRPAPIGTQILVVCEQRDGGQSAYGELVALAWTPRACQVVSCHLDHVNLRCFLQVRGDLPPKWITGALTGLLHWARESEAAGQRCTFGEFVLEFKAVLMGRDTGNCNRPVLEQPEDTWEESWAFDQNEGDSDDLSELFVESDNGEDLQPPAEASSCLIT